MGTTPSPTATQLSPCTTKFRQKICLILFGIVKKLGEVGFNEFKSTFNAFMGQIIAIIQPFETLLETLLTIDKFVYDTFVKPPLTAAISELASVQDTIKKPLSMLQFDTSCDDTGALQRGVNGVVGVLTKDVNGLRNWLERLDYNFQWQANTIAGVKKALKLLNYLTIKAEYQDWLDHNPESLAGAAYLFTGPE